MKNNLEKIISKLDEMLKTNLDLSYGVESITLNDGSVLKLEGGMVTGVDNVEELSVSLYEDQQDFEDDMLPGYDDYASLYIPMPEFTDIDDVDFGYVDPDYVDDVGILTAKHLGKNNFNELSDSQKSEYDDFIKEKALYICEYFGIEKD